MTHEIKWSKSNGWRVVSRIGSQIISHAYADCYASAILILAALTGGR